MKKLLRGYDIKILAGCAPCQPFSSHQKDKKDRSKHKDWKLLYQFSGLVREVNPHIVSMENVPELEREVVFKDFIQTLNDLGYNISYKVINAANYGVPQRRKRLLLLASRLNKIDFIPQTHVVSKTVRDAIGTLPKIEVGVVNTSDNLHIASRLSKKNTMRIQSSKPGGSWKDWSDDLILPCHKKMEAKLILLYMDE